MPKITACEFIHGEQENSDELAFSISKPGVGTTRDIIPLARRWAL
jgi:hypothetical protein